MLSKKSRCYLITVAGAALGSFSPVLAQSSGQTPAYLDPKQLIEVRIDDLIGRMTLKEKIGQLNLPCVYVRQLGRDIPSKTEACKTLCGGNVYGRDRPRRRILYIVE